MTEDKLSIRARNDAHALQKQIERRHGFDARWISVGIGDNEFVVYAIDKGICRELARNLVRRFRRRRVRCVFTGQIRPA